MKDTNFLKKKNGDAIAYSQIPGKSPGIIFLSGFMADMTGTKATYFEQVCRDLGHSFVRFDYSGHGQSTAKFEDCGIGCWKEDAIEVLDKLTEGPQILLGSSMGGWIMFLVAKNRKERIHALMGIAPAPDFVEPLILDRLNSQQKLDLETKGFCYTISENGEQGHPITRKMLDDGMQNRVLTAPIDISCPIRLVHGLNDFEVPWSFSDRLLNNCTSSNVTLTLVKDAGHRLSQAHELQILSNTLKGIL